MMPGCGTPKGVTTTPAALFGGQQAAEHQPEKTIRVFPNPAQLCETDSGFGGSRRTTSLACWAGCKQYKSALSRCLYEWKSIFSYRMKTLGNRKDRSGGARATAGTLIGLCLAVILIGLWLRPDRKEAPLENGSGPVGPAHGPVGSTGSHRDYPGATHSALLQQAALVDERTAEEIVASKVAQFARSRRHLAEALARRHGTEIPGVVAHFFDALEAGDWEESQRLFKDMTLTSEQSQSPKPLPEFMAAWPAVLDAFGAAEQAHEWPAQQLLDYGHAILSALRPGMVFVGGTDAGRWIPALINETSGSERHIMLTQNALADARYLEYLELQFGERFSALTHEDSQASFMDYMKDAQERLMHDQQFPDQPKQVRPREDIRIEDGRMQVSGQTAVMAINERLLQTLMEKNPGLSFALLESFPLQGTYAEAMPLGPVMELQARDQRNYFNAERAEETARYWQSAAEQILANPEAAASPAVLKTYSHDTAASANFLAAHGFNMEAERNYRLSMDLWPSNPEPVSALADLLAREGRLEDAWKLLHQFAQSNPELANDLEQTSGLWREHSARPAVQP
jgi:hypothetical protein